MFLIILTLNINHKQKPVEMVKGWSTTTTSCWTVALMVLCQFSDICANIRKGATVPQLYHYQWQWTTRSQSLNLPHWFFFLTWCIIHLKIFFFNPVGQIEWTTFNFYWSKNIDYVIYLPNWLNEQAIVTGARSNIFTSPGMK